MAVTLETSLRNNVADAVDAAVNTGSGTAQLKITTSDDTVLSVHDMSDPAFGAAVSGTITANSITDETSADATGTAAKGKIYDKDANLLMTVGVGESGSGMELIIDSTSISTGATVTINSLTITCPAS